MTTSLLTLEALKKHLTPELRASLQQVQNVEELTEVLSGFQLINPRSAGIDIGSLEHFVAVSAHLCAENVRSFGSFTRDLETLADWLKSLGISSVVMESTGHYWQSLFEVLESRGLEVCLVNARHAKNVTERKSDVSDCQWLLQLHTYGLLGASFIPEEGIRTLRTYIRHRGAVEKHKAASLQAIHKSLTAMNLKFQHLVSDIEGVASQKIIRAMIEGERDPKVLAQYRHARMKANVEDLEASLEGHYRDEHIFTLEQALKTYDFYKAQMRDCDQVIEQQLLQLTPADGRPQATKPKKQKARKNQYGFALKHHLKSILGTDLTLVEGLAENTILEVLAQTGSDLTQWKTANHFASWLKLSPNPKISGGKILGYKKIKTDNRAAQAFRLAAQSLHASQSYLGHYYRRISHRRGKKIAVIAVARKLAVIFYTLVVNKVEYIPRDFGIYEQQHKQKMKRNLEKKAEKLGLKLVPIEG